MDPTTRVGNLLLDNVKEHERARVRKVLDAPFAGIRPKHIWVAPRRTALEAILDGIDPRGWRHWLGVDPDTYPPRFAIAVSDADNQEEVGRRALLVERRVAELAAAVERLKPQDFAYYTKDGDALLVPDESESCQLAYTDALGAYELRRRRGLETQVLLHADIPSDLHAGESPDHRPFSAMLNLPVVRRAIARRLAELRNMGHDILPPGYLDEASLILGSPSRLDSLAQSTLVDFQVLIG